MIKLPSGKLAARTQAALQTYQIEIDNLPDYEQRVSVAKSSFARYNKPDREPFKTVRKTLATLCCGAQRCMYCEDSCADEVEHFKPKDLYPELCFVWENYLYSCGRCNGPKRSKFAVFVTRTGHLIEVTRPKNAPIVPPLAGNPVLINPRLEDPLEFLGLDLETGIFCPQGRKSSQKYQRAEYTIRVLKLNERPELPQARRGAYSSYLAHLEQYVNRKSDGASTGQLDKLIRAIQRMSHPTVWREMQRQAELISILKDCFDAAPEAYLW